MFSKKITVFLSEGLPKGIREVKIDQWSGRAICGPRSRLGEMLKISELNSGACVYFLIGDSQQGSLPQVYVGEADGFKQRIMNHEYKKDWWKDVAVFFSQDGSLTKTGIKFLESVSIERLKGIGKCILDNNNQPAKPSMPKEDVSGLEVFYENIALIMPLLGFDIFVQDVHVEGKKELTLFCYGKGVKAEGILLNDGKIKVLKGSEAVQKNVTSFDSHFYRGLKDELLRMGRLVKKGDNLAFTDEYVFDSPSAAAAIILARSASGPVEWKDKNGTTLKEILEIAIEE